MLVLTRRPGESLVIGDKITVTVLGVKSGQVRIGVEAPKDIAVHREEVHARIQRGAVPGALDDEPVPDWELR